VESVLVSSSGGVIDRHGQCHGGRRGLDLESVRDGQGESVLAVLVSSSAG